MNKKEEFTDDEIQELLLELQYTLQDAAPGNPVVENFFRMGKLHLTNHVKTAGVTVDRDGTVFLMFAPDFVREILKKNSKIAMLEFILMHEAMHVILEHISRRKHREPFVWNIACDAIVNTTVLNIFSKRFAATECPDRFNFDNSKGANYRDEMNEFINKMVLPYSVKETVDSCYSSTAEEVYERLMKNAVKINISGLGTLDDHSGWDKKDGSGKGKTRAQKMAEDQLKEDLKESLKKAILGDQNAISKMAGKTPCGEFRELGINVTPRKLPWDKMLRNFIASRIDEHIEEVWHNPNRKLRQWYPNLILPNEFEVEDRDKLNVFIAVDTSGSMDGETLKKVQGILSCFPADKVDYKAISFDCDIYPIDSDITKCNKFRGGGGTSFQTVADYAQKQAPAFDCFIMLTDGFDSPPRVKNHNQWLWVLVPGGRAPGGRIGTVVNM